MTLLQLLKDCKSKNIVLSAEAGRLVVTAPVGGMEPELREALKAAKAELLSLVAAENPGAPCKACAPRSFGAVPLSPYQAPFWASFSEDGPAKAMPIIVEAFDFEVRVEPGVLQQALDWTVGRHDMLRTTFAAEGQTVLDRASVRLETRHVSPGLRGGAPVSVHDQAVHELLEEFLARPYDPARDAPLRAGLVESAEEGSTLVLALAHFAGDAASLEVILRDLTTFLRCSESAAALPGERPPGYLESLPAEASGQGGAFGSGLQYWCRQLRRLPPVHALPTDYARPIDRKAASFDFVMLTLPFDGELRAALRSRGVSPFVYLHTAMRVLLYRFGKVEELPVVTPMANRQHLADPTSVVGCFANEVALNIPLDPQASLGEILRLARGHLAEALDHQATPYTEVLKALSDARTRDWLPVAQVFFSYLSLGAGLPVRHRFDHVEGVNYDLSFVAADCQDRIKLLLGYDTKLFKEDTIERLGGLFSRICATMLGQERETPASLRLDALRVPAPEQRPWNLALALGITPETTVILPDAGPEPPVFDQIRSAAREARARIRGLAPSEPPAENEKALVVVTGGASSLEEAARAGAAAGARLCIVNHVPSARGLRELSALGGGGQLIVELPPGPARPSVLGVISLDNCRDLRDGERFLACSVDPACFAAAPGELLDLGKGLHVQFVAPGEIRIPLPNPATPYVWVDGKGLDLRTVAARLAQASGGGHAALSLAPSPVAGRDPDRLTAWIAPGSGPALAEARLADIDGGLPPHWPDQRVAISAMPLTRSGEVDRHALGQLPLLAPELLAELEDQFRARHGTPLTLRLEPGATAPARLHHSQVIPGTEHVTIAGKFAALGLDASRAVHAAANPSVVHGPPLRLRMNLSFREHMERFQDRELVFIDIDGQQTQFSGRAFLQRARNLLKAMQHKGLGPGDRVIVYCAREQELYSLAWACLLGGICMAGLLPPVAGQSPEPIHTRLGHIHAILGGPPVITMRGEPMPLDRANVHYFSDLLEEGARLGGQPTCHDTQADTLAYTAFTSGSTGAPKAVPLTASNVFSMIYAKMQTIGSIEGETSLSMTALDHVASLFCNSMYSTVCGARQVYCSFQYILAEPTRILDLVHKYRVSHTWAPDFTWRQLYESLKEVGGAPGRWDLSCLRHIISAAENTREATFRSIEEALLPYGMPPRVLLHSWGMSETSSLLTMSAPWDTKSHESHMGIIDAGRPMAGSAFRVADKKGEPVPEGAVGSFQVKGPSVLGGYYDNPKANAESFTRDGWFITGDLAMLRNGKVVFCGREKEQVVIKGQNIAQFDIEGSVDGIEGVEPTFSVVIGCRNEKTGDDDILVFAHTKLVAPDDRAAVIKRIIATLASHFGVVPAQVLLVEQEDVPKALLGKIQRTNILKRFLKGDFKKQVFEADMLLGNARTLPNWFARTRWARENLGEARGEDLAAALTRRRVVLVGPDSELGAVLARRLRAAGADVRLVPAASAEQPLHASESGQEAVTALFLLDGEPPCADGPEHAAWRKQVFVPLCSLVAGLWGRQGGVRNVVIVTAGGQATGDGAWQGPWSAAVAGLMASFSRQWEGAVRLVDVSGQSADTDTEALVRELAFGGAAPLAAWRDGRRLVPVLEPMDPTPGHASTDWASAFGRDRYCLCTGLTGRLGRDLLPQLLLLTNGNFLVLGRKPSHEGNAFLEDRCRLAPGWRERALYVQASLEDEGSIAAAMRAAAEHFGEQQGRAVPPGGVLHLAADTSERGFQDFAAEDLEEGLLRRLNHLEKLERAFANGGGTGPRIVFSSVLSFWGGADSALYAPTCALAEAYAHNHRLRAVSTTDTWHGFLWSRWEDSALPDDLIARLMEQRGLLTIDAPRGVVSLMAMLHRSANERGGMFMAGVNTEDPQISQYLRLPGQAPRPLKRLAAYVPHGVDGNTLRGFLRQGMGRQVAVRIHELAAPDYDERGRLLPGSGAAERTAAPVGSAEARMAAIWGRVLRLSQLDTSASFFELGGTSVLVPRLRKAVQDEFGVDIGTVGIFDYPSAREMAKACGGGSRGADEALKAREAAFLRAGNQRKARAARR